MVVILVSHVNAWRLLVLCVQLLSAKPLHPEKLKRSDNAPTRELMDLESDLVSIRTYLYNIRRAPTTTYVTEKEEVISSLETHVEQIHTNFGKLVRAISPGIKDKTALSTDARQIDKRSNMFSGIADIANSFGASSGGESASDSNGLSVSQTTPTDPTASRTTSADSTTSHNISLNSDVHVHISAIIYGGSTISDPTVIARCIDYAHSLEDFLIGPSFLGRDPLFGTRKWVFIAYRYSDESQMRYLTGWDDDTVAFTHNPNSLTTQPLNPSEGTGQSSDGIILYAIAYADKIIDDVSVVQSLSAYAKTGDMFTVGNNLFGCDPDPGNKKYGVIAYKCNAKGAMKYFVGSEDEKRTLGKYGC